MARHRIKRNFVNRKLGKSIPKVLAIIPVRGKSDILPNMALKPMAGKPLISYTIEQALKTKLLDKIVVISEEDKILNCAKRFPKVLTIKRPQRLSRPNSRIEPTVDFVLRFLKDRRNYQPEAVMLLYIHSPLRKYMHIEKAIDTMLIFNVDSVVSVCENFNSFYRHTKNGLIPLVKRRFLRLERHALYRENGAIYLSELSAIKKDDFLGAKIGHIIMLPEESVKIDSEFNFWMGERIMVGWLARKKGVKNGTLI